MRATFNRVKRIKDAVGAVPEQTRLNASQVEQVKPPSVTPTPPIPAVTTDSARARFNEQMKRSILRKKPEEK